LSGYRSSHTYRNAHNSYRKSHTERGKNADFVTKSTRAKTQATRYWSTHLKKRSKNNYDNIIDQCKRNIPEGHFQ